MLYILGGVVGLLVLVFALIGFISVTRGTPVKHVAAPGDASGPPAPGDSRAVARARDDFPNRGPSRIVDAASARRRCPAAAPRMHIAGWP